MEWKEHFSIGTIYKNNAQSSDLRIRYGVLKTPFSNVLVGATDKGICWLSFYHDDVQSLRDKFPGAFFEEADMSALFKNSEVDLDLYGTDFQLSVWGALLTIPYGQTVSYKDIAEQIGNSKAVRAVGTANGRNPVSLLVPCHRVIAHDGSLGGYASGLDMKTKILRAEAA